MYSYLPKQMHLPSKQDYEPDNILLPISQKECVNLRKNCYFDSLLKTDSLRLPDLRQSAAMCVQQWNIKEVFYKLKLQKTVTLS